ncbi:Heparinase II/III-like protein [Evansella caseinilytica]|uniref:Heparinase II/III-like protein n=1 Tax=Evansella caseinilytica TaxID=1503961 RepID=A0A1H3U0Z7_9BACI|nr:heparinase II/III family protein [Evansella caseinilytica]SDZ56012.1 Heparinase II/III-like protein [Evansella caseinilytica]
MERNKLKHILAKSHKRHGAAGLFFGSREEQASWGRRIQQSDALQPALVEIRGEAERLQLLPDVEIPYAVFVEFAKTGARKRYEQAYFLKRRRLNTFAIMTLLEPENDVYRTQLENAVWSVCNEYTWCLPAHLDWNGEGKTADVSGMQLLPDPSGKSPVAAAAQPPPSIDLFAAETAFTLSEIIRLTEDVIDPFLYHRVVREVYQRVFHPYIHSSYSWETAEHNWAAVCAGSIGAAAIHLIKNMDDLAGILEKVLAALENYLTGFDDDGACLEGYTYWQYGFGFFVYFADLLQIATAGQVNLFHKEKVRQIALFQQRCFIHQHIAVNFSDTLANTRPFSGMSHYLKNVYADFHVPPVDICAGYTDDHCSRWPVAFRNLLWFDEEKQVEDWPDGTVFFPASQWVLSRHTSAAAQYAFAAKGGHNDEPHNHNDIGHFMLYKNGEAFLCDIGSGLYSRDYFGEKRYTFLCTSSGGHSVPIIHQREQLPGKQRFATVEAAMTEAETDVFVLDMTNAYEAPGLRRLIRTFTWKKSTHPRLTLKDSFDFSAGLSSEAAVVERFITPLQTIEQEENKLVLSGREGKLAILYQQELLEPRWKTAAYTDHFGEKQQVTLLDFHVKTKESTLTVVVEFQFEVYVQKERTLSF